MYFLSQKPGRTKATSTYNGTYNGTYNVISLRPGRRTSRIHRLVRWLAIITTLFGTFTTGSAPVPPRAQTPDGVSSTANTANTANTTQPQGATDLFGAQVAQAQVQSPTPLTGTPPSTYRVGTPTPAPTLTAIPDTNYEDQAIDSARDTLVAQVSALPLLVGNPSGTLVTGLLGGRIVSVDGSFTVGIFPGSIALTDTMSVQITPIQGATRHGYPLAYAYDITATRVSTGQPITQFKKNVALVWTVTPTGLATAGIKGSPLKAYTLDAQGGFWQEEVSRWNSITRQLVVSTPHFSSHAAGDGFDKVNNYLPTVKDFEVDLQTGAASVRYPIELPPGPGGLTPNVSLSYSSGNVDRVDASNQGTSNVGWGWSLSGSYIAAKQHFFGNYSPWTASIVSEGANGDLVKGTDGYWHTSMEGFTRIKFNPGSDSSRTDDWWEAWAKDGTHYVFDLRALDMDEANSPQTLTVYKWLLHTVTTPQNNTLTYSYQYEKWDGSLSFTPIAADRTRATYPYRIEYGGVDPSRGNNSKIRVEFALSSQGVRSSPTTGDVSDNDRDKGLYQGYYVTRIDVKRLQQTAGTPPGQDAQGYITLRSYEFTQDFSITLPDNQSPPHDWRHLTLLKITRKAPNGQQLPSTSFEYVSRQSPPNDCAANGPTRYDRGHLCFANNGYGGTVAFYYDAAGGQISQAYRRVRAKRVQDGLSLDTSSPHNVVYRYASHGATTNSAQISGEIGAGNHYPLNTPDSEFRGFAWVEEQDPTGQVTQHYFNQDDLTKSKEWRTQMGKQTTLDDGLNASPTATPNPNWVVAGNVQSVQDPNDASNNVWQVNPGTVQSPNSIQRTVSVRDGVDVAMRFMMKSDTNCETSECNYNTVSTWKMVSDQQYGDGKQDYWGVRVARKYNESSRTFQNEAWAIWGLHNGTNGAFVEVARDMSNVQNGLTPRRTQAIHENLWYWLKLRTSPDGRFALELYRPYGAYGASQDYIMLKTGDGALDNQGNNSNVPSFPAGQTWKFRHEVNSTGSASGTNFSVLDDAYSETRTVYSQSDSVFTPLSIPEEPYNNTTDSPYAGQHNNLFDMKIWFVPVTESRSTIYGMGIVNGQAVQGLNKQSRQVFRYDEGSQTRYGNQTSMDDYGDVGNPDDDRSTRTTYAVADRFGQVGQEQYIVNRQAQSDTYRGIAGAPGSALVARSRLYYDGQTSPGTIPAGSGGRGDVTKQEAVSVENGQPTTTTVTQQFLYTDLQGNYDYGNKTVAIDPNGNQTRSVFDGYYHAFPVEVRYPNGRSDYTAYDFTLDMPSTTTDMNGTTTNFKYDVFGRPSSSWTNGFGSETNPNDRYVFSDINQPSVSVPFYINYQHHVGAQAGTEMAWQTRWYDGRGRTVQNVSRKDDAANRVIVVDSTYNLAGQVADRTLPYEAQGGGMTTRVTPDTAKPKISMFYDGMGRTTKVVNPDGTYTLNDFNWLLWSMSSDESGVSEKWQHNDVLGRMDFVKERDLKDPANVKEMLVQYSYDSLDRLVKTLRDPGGANQTVGTMVYDGLGRKRQMTDADMGTWEYDYDAAGNLKTQRDALYLSNTSTYASHQVFFKYDSMNRITQKFYGQAHFNSNVADVRYYYDNEWGLASNHPTDATDMHSWGRLRAAEVTLQGQGSSKANGHMYAYDTRGLLTQEVITTTYTTRDYILGYSYDVGGRLTSSAYPNPSTPETAQITYNTQGLGLPRIMGSSLGGPLPVAEATYNERGQLDLLRQGTNSPSNDNLFTDYGYDDATTKRGWLTATKVTSADNTKYLDMSMTYTANGNVSQVQQAGAGSAQDPSFTNTYGYDGFNRLTSAISNGTSSLFPTEEYGFDSIGRMTTRKIGGTSYSYAYGDPAHKDAPTGYRGSTFGYDAAGNQTSVSGATGGDTDGTGASGPQTRVFDPENRLVSVTTTLAGGIVQTSEFIYDANGQRIIKNVTTPTPAATNTPTMTPTNTATSTPTKTSTPTSTATACPLISHSLYPQTGDGGWARPMDYDVPQIGDVCLSPDQSAYWFSPPYTDITFSAGEYAFHVKIETNRSEPDVAITYRLEYVDLNGENPVQIGNDVTHAYSKATNCSQEDVVSFTSSAGPLHLTNRQLRLTATLTYTGFNLQITSIKVGQFTHLDTPPYTWCASPPTPTLVPTYTPGCPPTRNCFSVDASDVGDSPDGGGALLHRATASDASPASSPSPTSSSSSSPAATAAVGGGGGSTARAGAAHTDGFSILASPSSAVGRTLYIGGMYEEDITNPSDTTPPYIVYYNFGGRLVAMRRANQPDSATDGQLRIVGDHLGSTSLIVDTTSSPRPQVVQRLYYKPYGEVAQNYGTAYSTALTSISYTGQRLDGDSGLMYYGARYYDPALSFFISADNIAPNPGNAKTRNRYSYTLNNPVKYADPTGQCVDKNEKETCSDLETRLKRLGFRVEEMNAWEYDDLSLILEAVNDLLEAAQWDENDFKDAMGITGGIYKNIVLRRAKEGTDIAQELASTNLPAVGQTGGEAILTVFDRNLPRNGIVPSRIFAKSSIVHELAHVMDGNTHYFSRAMANGTHSSLNSDGTYNDGSGITGEKGASQYAQGLLLDGTPINYGERYRGTSGNPEEAARAEDWAEAVTAYVYHNKLPRTYGSFNPAGIRGNFVSRQFDLFRNHSRGQ